LTEIEAVSVAAPVQRLAGSAHVTWITHSVFEHAVNLCSGRQLITLTDIRGGNLPYGICCRFEDRNLYDLFQHGTPFTLSCDAERLSSGNLVVRLESAVVWQPARPVIDSTVANDGAASLALWLRSLTGTLASLPHIRWLASALDDLPPVPGGQPWVARFAIRVAALVSAVHCADWPGAEKAAVELLGLGIGLTPSGDDFLAGFIAAGLALGPRDAFGDLARAVAERAETTTTLVSSALLRALSRDELSERFGTFLSALGQGPNALAAGAQSMLDFGSSSGLETMYGLVYGLRTVRDIGFSGSPVC
jgi:hypothetical protein